MKKSLFLDFDGVLHPNFSQEGEYFSRTSCLVDALDGFAGDVEVTLTGKVALARTKLAAKGIPIRGES